MADIDKDFVVKWNNSVSEHGLMAGVPWLGALWNDLTGRTAQDREFVQQEKLLHEEQAWSDERARMARMKAAGINPNTAAAGIAGTSSNVSAPSVPSASGASAAGVGALANLANAVTGGALNLAQAKTETSSMEFVIKNLEADYFKKLAEQGYTELEIEALKVDNKYREQNTLADLRTKALNCDNLAQQYKVLESQYDLQLKMINKAIQDAELAKDQSAYYEAMSQKVNAEASWSKLRLEFWREHGFDLEASSLDKIAVEKMENGQNAKDFITGYANYRKSVVTAEQDAINESYAKNIGTIKREEYTAESLFKRASNAFELAGQLASIGLEATGLRDYIDGSSNSVGAVRQSISSSIEGLWNKIEMASSDEERERYFGYIQELNQIQALSNKELKKYLKMSK